MTQIGESSGHVRVQGPRADAPAVLVSWAALSDVGKRRAVNEDSVVANPPIFAVADGMGGHAAGDIASKAVVDRLGAIDGPGFTTHDTIDEALVLAVVDIDTVGDTNTLGTGTTVTGVALTLVGDTPTWAVFNIGDSRVYQYRGGSLDRVTVDHSVVQELVDAGLITSEQAETHPDSNIITRAVGFHEKPVPDYTLLDIVEGQRLLVCSDGLTKELTDHGIEYYLKTAASAEVAARELVDAALSNGGRDNVTVLVVDVLADAEPAAVDPAEGLAADPRTSAEASGA